MEQTRRTIMLYARSPAAVLVKEKPAPARSWRRRRSTGNTFPGAAHRPEARRRRSSPSTAAPSPNRCWRRSCSAMRKAPLPAHGAAADAGCWKPPTVAPCFWMRSAKCRCTNPAAARAGRRPLPGSAGSSRWRSTFASSAPPTTTGAGDSTGRLSRRSVLPPERPAAAAAAAAGARRRYRDAGGTLSETVTGGARRAADGAAARRLAGCYAALNHYAGPATCANCAT